MIGRKDLFTEHGVEKVGTVTPGQQLELYLSFQVDEVMGSGRDFQGHRGDLSRWPILSH